jgi:predicted amidophosphoribosyltransferase
MKNRTASDQPLSDDLITLLKAHLTILTSKHKIAAIIPLPSRTWGARDQVAALLADHLQVPVIHDLLAWTETPLSRQGELLNNDQRHFNVHQRMQANAQIPLAEGALILLDDYIGSGNTLKEAARAIRATKSIKQEIIPFTIAAVKWHLGKPGFV